MSSPLKNVVIVGGGPYTGGKLASGLASALPATHRVILIDQRDYAYATAIAARASVVPGWEKRVAVHLAPIFAEGSRHLVFTNVTVTSFTPSSVTIDKPIGEFGQTVQADIVVLATSSLYSFPAHSHESTLEATRERLVKSQQDVAAASNILVVGGGPYGTEWAGEVGEHFKGAKTVTLVCGGPYLIGAPFPQSMSDGLVKQLSRLNVKVLFGQKVDTTGLENGPVARRVFTTSTGEKIEADYVLVATGSPPNTELVKQSLPQALNSDGRVKIKDTFQLENANNVFAAGDIISLDLPRTAATGVFTIPLLQKNIVALIAGKSLSSYKPGKPFIAVTVGKSGGVSYLPFGTWFGAWFTRMVKSKNLLYPDFAKLYHAPSAAVA